MSLKVNEQKTKYMKTFSNAPEARRALQAMKSVIIYKSTSIKYIQNNIMLYATTVVLIYFL